ncbi:MAG: N-acetylmuramoyl-L-alanine amidase [Acetobacteraceae bacterium]|nr:N-acetylmuramoyl-L-alanine amidase [Acetobacteraceae bacterium]
MRGWNGAEPRHAPLEGRRRWLFASIGAALGAAGIRPAAAADASAPATVSAAGGGRTRVEVPLEPGTAWRLSAAKEPPRLVLRMPGMAWRGPPVRLPGAGLVSEARRTGDSLVLVLAAPVAPPTIGARGDRLVIELFPGSMAGFARLAEGGHPLAAALPPPRTLPLVVLDPGHGGRDPGAIGPRGTQEKRITLAATLELKRRLEAGGRCRVLLTRGRDVFVPLADRIGMARKRDAALFLSLHADSAPGARGASVYTLSETASDALSAALARRENAADQAGGLRLPSVTPEVGRILFSLMRQETRAGSDRLARLAVSSLRGGDVRLLPNTHRRAAFAVLKAPDVPAALVEMGFLSHPADEAALNRPAHRARLALALAGAVEGFLQARARSSLAGADWAGWPPPPG